MDRGTGPAGRAWAERLRRWTDQSPSGWLLAAVTLAALLYKLPNVMLHGRLFAEEGTYFLVALDGRSFAAATTYLFRGSLLLLTNWTVWLAALAPVDAIPRLTTWISVAVLLGVAAQFAGVARRHGIGRGAACLVMAGFVLSPLLDEALATSTNLQWICSVSVMLLLVSPPPAAIAGRMLPATLGWLLVCGLTGVPSCFLAPFFWLRALAERSRPHLVMAAVLSAATLLQAYLVLTHDVGDRPFQFRPLLVATAIAFHTIVLPFLGRRAASTLHDATVGGGMDTARALLVVLPSLAAVAAGAWRARRAGAPLALLFALLVGGAAATTINCFGVLGPPELLLGPTNNLRYFVLFFFCLLAMVAWIARDRGPVGWSALLVLGWVTLLGAAIYFPARHQLIDRGPSWETQVAACRARRAATCEVRIWPDVAPGVDPWVARVAP